MAIYLTLLFLITATLRYSAAAPEGFGLTLHRHPDSPFSPSFKLPNASASRLDIIYQRSQSRYDYLLSKPTVTVHDDVHIPVTPGGIGTWEYLTAFAIGTPPVVVTVNIDTGSGLTWIQCLPCRLCFKQKAPIFNPANSSSYGKIFCEDPSCNEDIPLKLCKSNCEYMAVYGDRSWSKGDVAVEDFTFHTGNPGGDETKTLQGIIFGCSHSSKGIYNPQEQGILGLDMSSPSLILQYPATTKLKFSYCLVPYQYTGGGSHMLFGDHAKLAGDPIPLVTEFGDDSYYLNLDDIYVGSERLDIPNGTFHRKGTSDGGMLLDSGTSMMYLVDSAYQKLINKLKEKITLPLAPEDDGFLCYKGSSGDLVERNIPIITLHFSGGLEFVWPSEYSFFVESKTVCLAVLSSGRGRTSILGVLAQQNKNIGIDVDNKKVYIFPTECISFDRDGP